MSSLATHPAIAIVVLLAVLIFFHELGHFLVGKFFKIGVETFSIGFGPKLLGFTHQHTEYKVALIPLGGYVKFAGAIQNEDVPQHFIGREMYKAPPWQRALVLVAGPAANFVLAMVAFTWLGMQGIPHQPSIIGTVRLGSVADQVGLQAGDRITRIQDQEIQLWGDMHQSISQSPGSPLTITVQRRKELKQFKITPKTVEVGTKKIGRIGIGFGFTPAVLTSNNPQLKALGLNTGDEVIAISYLLDGKPINLPIDNWQDLADHLDDAIASKPKDIGLTIKEKNTVWLNLDAETQNGYQFLTKNRLSHSLLTVKEINSKADEKTTLLKAKDKLTHFSGKLIRDIYHLQELLNQNKAARVDLTIQRSGETLVLATDMLPELIQKAEGSETIFLLPVDFYSTLKAPPPHIEKYDTFFSAAAFGIRKTADFSKEMVIGLWGLITGAVSLKALGGPILIAKIAGESIRSGLETFIQALALISINLGVINLFPIPILDGGQLCLVFAEMIRRKPLSLATIENFYKIGFAMVMSLVILATYNDINRFWLSMLK